MTNKAGWNQKHFRWHGVGNLLMAAYIENTLAIKVMDGFRPLSNTYTRNVYTLAAISALVYALIIQFNMFL